MTVGGPPDEPRWSLTDHNGRRVTEADFRGRYQLVFFGFTHCRMVCPRALTKLSVVLDDIGGLAEQIQPLYISVDPKRDTPDVMKAFLEGSYPNSLVSLEARRRRKTPEAHSGCSPGAVRTQTIRTATPCRIRR